VIVGAVLFVVTAAHAPSAAARGRSAVAALQVALRVRGLYVGTVDGIKGPGTRGALVAFQRRHGLLADGIAGRRTRRALGRHGRHSLGSRALHGGLVGWDVAQLQFLLAWHGFPSGAMDGVLGAHGVRALRRFQAWAGLAADGVAGRITLRALRRPRPRCRRGIAWPVRGSLGDGFGPRGDRFHTGLDFAAAYGARVRAARAGRVSVGYDPGGYGTYVVVTDGFGVSTWYAHLSRVSTRSGRSVGVGRTLGRVGSSGRSTGPHLHFELRDRGAAVDPRPCL
jgi:peptidoglycan hydrolase-like protein with peptidoglycan-binding domain